MLYGYNINQSSTDQHGKVANPARGKLNRENEYFPVSVRAGEFGLARRVRLSRPASACSFSTLRQAESGYYIPVLLDLFERLKIFIVVLTFSRWGDQFHLPQP